MSASNSIEAITLDNILVLFEKMTFGKDKSSYIVGGERKLEQLISEGKVRATKPTMHQHGKWYCNAADVLRHCRNMRSLLKTD